MKALYVSWGIQMNDIPEQLKQLGIETDWYQNEVSVQSYDSNQMEALLKYLKEGAYDFVITNNFLQTVSEACHRQQIKYISWIFDSPQIDLYTKYALYEENYVFVFDKKQLERMKKQGLRHVYYRPLAVETKRIASLQVTMEDVQNFSADISFVGMLYENNHYNQDVAKFTEEEKAYLDNIILKTVLCWEKGRSVFSHISEEMSLQLKRLALPWTQYEIALPYFQELYYIVRKVTEIERICILNGLALNHKVDLYTVSNTEALKNVRLHGRVDYNEELPKIYNLSKINLNVTMRSIETGVPQRIFDIMGSAGFVLSNYQEELEELFVPDQEIVFFHNMEELVEKVNYYLTHEQERIQIAVNGYYKVTKCYSYKTALTHILKTI